MSRPGRRGPLPVATAVLAAAVLLVGCSSQGDPLAPVLVEGQLVDVDGGPVAGTKLVLIAWDPVDPVTGKAALILFQGSYVTGLGGSFSIHLFPNEAMARQAASHEGRILFELRSDGESAITEVDALPTFTRDLLAGKWTGAPPRIDIRPSGVQLGALPLPIAA